MSWGTRVLSYVAYRAYCPSCDWYGPHDRNEREAEADRLAHWREHDEQWAAQNALWDAEAPKGTP